MDFGRSERGQHYLDRLQAFMDEHVLPAEPVYAAQRAELAAAGRPHGLPPVVEELKAEARRRGLWNLFLPDADDPAHGLGVLDYAPLAELTGWSPELAPGGDQLRRAGHRQHGDPAPVRHRRAEGALAGPAARRARSGRPSR